MARRDYSCSITMSDLLFNMLLAFVALFILAFAQMAIKQQKSSVEVKAEYLVTVSWPNDFDDDIDVYVEDPVGHLVFFRRREDGLMHLDRDDLGKSNDRIQTPFGIVEYPENREIVTFRGTMEGEYVINLHLYRRNGRNEKPCPVKVQLDQLAPFRTLGIKTIDLTKNGQEVTAMRFTLMPDKDNKLAIGQITDIFKSLIGASSLSGETDDYVPQPTYNGNRDTEVVPDNLPAPTIPD